MPAEHGGPRHKHQNDLLHFLGKHLITGLIAGELTLALLLFLNVGGLRSLIWESSVRGIALFLLIMFFALTFGSIGMGAGVIGLSKGNRDSDIDEEGRPR